MKFMQANEHLKLRDAIGETADLCLERAETYDEPFDHEDLFNAMVIFQTVFRSLLFDHCESKHLTPEQTYQIAEECERNREFVKAMLDIDLVEVIRADWPEFVEKKNNDLR